jgi:hypothetical protein
MRTKAISTIAILVALAISTPVLSQSSSTTRGKPSGVVLGMLADTVLKLRGKGQSSRQVGRDENGLLVEWEYPGATYLMGRRTQDGVEAYRVIKITPRK